MTFEQAKTIILEELDRKRDAFRRVSSYISPTAKRDFETVIEAFETAFQALDNEDETSARDVDASEVCPRISLAVPCIACGGSVELTEEEEQMLRNGKDISAKMCDNCKQAILQMCKQMEEKAEALVKKRAEEHPVKTNATKFKEVFGADLLASSYYPGRLYLVGTSKGSTDRERYDDVRAWLSAEYKEPKGSDE